MSQKIWDDDPRADQFQPAGAAYTSTRFEKSRAYARRFGESWMVFSAKYGLIDADRKIENYNETFKKGGPNLVQVETLRSQVSAKSVFTFPTIVVLGGKPYVDRARLAFASHKVVVLDPSRGMPIGKRLHWLMNPEPPRTDA